MANFNPFHQPIIGSRPIVLLSTGTAVTVTGTTTETILKTVLVPGGLVGKYGSIRLTCIFSYTNVANIKTWRVRLGGISGTAFITGAVTTTSNTLAARTITNRGSYSSQVCWVAGSTAAGSGGANNLITGTIDTSVDQNLVVTGQVANAADFVTIESCIVEVFPAD